MKFSLKIVFYVDERIQNILIRNIKRRLIDKKTFFYEKFLMIESWRIEKRIRKFISNFTITCYRNHFMMLYLNEYRNLNFWITFQIVNRDVKINTFYLKTIYRLFFEIFEIENEYIRQKFLEMQIKIRSISIFDDNLNFEKNQYMTYQRIINNFFLSQFENHEKQIFSLQIQKKQKKNFIVYVRDMMQWS